MVKEESHNSLETAKNEKKRMVNGHFDGKMLVFFVKSINFAL
jgi:hypothetical protein